MELKDLLLKKEEIQFRINEDDFLSSTLFTVPIHPKLLHPDIKLDERLAINVFPQAAKEWYKDLQAVEKKLPPGKAKSYINDLFLKKPLSVKQHYDNYQVDPPGYWEANVTTLMTGTGFASGLSIDRDAGGTLYFDKEEFPGLMVPPLVNFSKEKLQEYSYNGKIHEDSKSAGAYASAHIYLHHNVDYYPGALFLRNWAILYLNEALKQVLKQ